MQRTESPVAAGVLERFEQLLGAGAFVKVMPHDYKRVLRELAEKETLVTDTSGNGAVVGSRRLDVVGDAGA